LLPPDEGDDAVDRVEVLGDELVVADADVERLLQEADELEHTGGVDDSGFDQRCRSRQACRVVAEEVVRGEELAEFGFDGRSFAYARFEANPAIS
jgi:hypothetical protein